MKNKIINCPGHSDIVNYNFQAVHTEQECNTMTKCLWHDRISRRGLNPISHDKEKNETSHVVIVWQTSCSDAVVVAEMKR